MTTVQRTVSLEPYHLEWLKENSINKSALLRRTIDKLMKKEKGRENGREQIFEQTS